MASNSRAQPMLFAQPLSLSSLPQNQRVPVNGNCEHPSLAGQLAKRYSNCPDYREQTGLRDDICAVDCRANTGRRPLKYQTRNFHYAGVNPHSLCEVGIGLMDDGVGISQCAIDVDSHLRIDPPLTNLGFPQQLRCLPTQMPFLGRGCVDTDVEMHLRGKDTNGSKPCLPRETNFHDRHFDHFDHLCYNPNAVENTVFPYNQSGMDTRHIRQQPHRNGVGCRPTVAVNGGDLRIRNCDQKEAHKYSAGRFDDRGNKNSVNLQRNRPALSNCGNGNCKCGANCKCVNCKC